MGSVYQLSKLKRMASGAWKGRKAIPQAVRAEYQRLYGPGREAIFWAPAGTAPGQAKARFAEWQALIECRISTLRQAAGTGQDLTQRQVGALAGDWYRWFVGLHEDNPGAYDRWAKLRDLWWHLLVDAAGDHETGNVDFEASDVREELHPMLVRDARIDQFLADRGVTLSQRARDSLLSAVIGQFLAATKTLQRRASGDWGPDPHETSLAPADHSLALTRKFHSTHSRTARARATPAPKPTLRTRIPLRAPSVDGVACSPHWTPSIGKYRTGMHRSGWTASR